MISGVILQPCNEYTYFPFSVLIIVINKFIVYDNACTGTILLLFLIFLVRLTNSIHE